MLQQKDDVTVAVLESGCRHEEHFQWAQARIVLHLLELPYAECKWPSTDAGRTLLREFELQAALRALSKQDE